jgi:hypothetical protein
MSRMFLLFGWTIWKNRRQWMALIRFLLSHNNIRRWHESLMNIKLRISF